MSKDASSIEEALPSGQREYAESLSIWGWIRLLSRVIGITFVLLFKAARAALGGSKKGHSFYKYLVYEGMCDYQSELDVVAIQNLLPSTLWVCRRFARKNGLGYAVVRLRDGTIAVKIGAANPSKVIVFFHGGGYMAPALPEHAHLACGFSKTFPADVSVYVLQYALVSETANQYPRQLQQAVSLLDYLLNLEKIPPPAITLIGDSAGAHLALGLLLHLAHPNPRVAPLKAESHLAGVALISPWIMAPGSAGDCPNVNKNKDILHERALDYWTQNFLAKADPDYWNSPLTTPIDWWANLPVDDIFVTYGENEVLREKVTKFCDILRTQHAHTKIKEYEGEVHVHMIMNRFLLINEVSESEEHFRNWLGNQIKSK